MLNELHKLSTTLASNSIRQANQKPDYKSGKDAYMPLPNGDCYRIWLCNDGSVAKVELMDKDLVVVCRKYGNNQQTFPAFNIAPLYRIISDDDKAYYDALVKGEEALDIERLKESICVNDNWNEQLLRKVNGCLHKKITAMPEKSAIFVLMSITEQLDGDSFRKSLKTCVWGHLQRDIKTYLPILLHKGNKKIEQSGKDTGSLSIILDLVDWERFGDPIASESTTKRINEWLWKSINEGDTIERIDAFGTKLTDFSETMPTVRLAFGDVVLRSMFKENHCQSRYRFAGDKSFPISKANRTNLQSAFKWLAKSDNEGKTWRKIDHDALIFVYPDKLPEIPPKFAELFCGNDNNKQSSIPNESRFEAIAKNFICTLSAIEPHEKPKNIQIFALNKLTNKSTRAKVIFTRNLTVDGLLKAVDDWQSGCNNLPAFTSILPIIPFPLSISKNANKVWKQNGSQADGKNGVKLMHYYQGIDLLLDAPESSQVLRIVRGVINNSSGLVLFVGNKLPRVGIQSRRKEDPINDFHKTEMGNVLMLLGLLLDKSGAKKEDYMRDAAYLIGQVLKISDALHSMYCEIKRDGDIPPQLAGNSVFVTASETPVKALALLSTRMNPYIAWAKQYRAQKKEKKSSLAAWYIRQFEELMPQLRPKLTEDIRFNDLEKAQLFIGYLAELPKSENKQSVEQENAYDEQ